MALRRKRQILTQELQLAHDLRELAKISPQLDASIQERMFSDSPGSDITFSEIDNEIAWGAPAITELEHAPYPFTSTTLATFDPIRRMLATEDWGCLKAVPGAVEMRMKLYWGYCADLENYVDIVWRSKKIAAHARSDWNLASIEAWHFRVSLLVKKIKFAGFLHGRGFTVSAPAMADRALSQLTLTLFPSTATT